MFLKLDMLEPIQQGSTEMVTRSVTLNPKAIESIVDVGNGKILVCTMTRQMLIEADYNEVASKVVTAAEQ